MGGLLGFILVLLAWACGIALVAAFVIWIMMLAAGGAYRGAAMAIGAWVLLALICTSGVVLMVLGVRSLFLTCTG